MLETVSSIQLSLREVFLFHNVDLIIICVGVVLAFVITKQVKYQDWHLNPGPETFPRSATSNQSETIRGAQHSLACSLDWEILEMQTFETQPCDMLSY